ncbi:carboxypeptidase-like regulatory domain-containing protein [Fluviicola sp.]|uniref:TonB-dependent receptor n=1 Tax=Fluviicola sp. TaxID=1917219 RepID=UPI0031CDC353
MKSLITQFLFLLAISASWGQENATISGYIHEGSSGEPIIGGQVYVPSIRKGAVTNEFGFYSLTLPKGSYELIYRGGGLPNDTISINLTQDTTITSELGKTTTIEEVEINAKKADNVNSTKIGQIELDINQIKKLPAFLGEVDVLKTIQLLPGVSSVSEGGQGFYVRGGGPDQNLVLLDNAQVYNASHLFGFFSVFNSDAIKNVNLIKGSMPANFGGRLSSVLEVNMNEGNNKKFKVTGGLGLISSRLTLEGPIVKNKGSFIVSARRTYVDLFMKAFIKKSSAFYGSSYFFYDLNAKLNYRLGPKDKIYLSGYYGKDLFNFGNKKEDFSVKMPWGNGIAALRWNHQFSSKLFMNTTATLTDYLFSFGSEQDQFKFELKSGIRDYGGKVELSYFPNTRHSIKTGVDYLYHTFTPTSVSASQDEVVFDTGLAQKLYSHESGIYFLDEVDIASWLRVNAGVRVSMYQFTGPFTRYYKGVTGHTDSTKTYEKGDIIKSYSGFEPRISARFLLKDKSSIKAGFTYNNQYVHLASLSAVSLPTDIWYPSTDKAHPQKGWQASLGYFRNFNDNKWETSVEVYYKKMENVIEFKQGALPSDNVNDNTDNLLVYGTGWSYGAEFFIKRTFGKLTGWIGYTLAKSDRYFPDIQAAKYPAKYDRRHDLTLVGTYELNKRWTFGFSFIYASGNTLTLPNSWYFNNQDLLFNYGPRNSTRMAPYHRLDISATWYDKPTKTKIDRKTGEKIEVVKKFRQNVAFSVYNVYNRANPYFLYIDNDGNIQSNDFKISVKQVSLFPILPSVTWNFEF